MSDKPKMSTKRKILIAVGVIFVILAFVSTNNDQNDPLASLEYPQNQAAIVEASKTAMEKAKKAENDMQKGSALNERNKTICANLGSLSVDNWVGIISKIDSNSDGFGVLEIQIAKNIFVKTWNNSLSDSFHDTLIKPSTALFETVSNLKKGQKVKFSGNLFKDSSTCIVEASLSLDGKLKEPEYIFKFSQVTPIKD